MANFHTHISAAAGVGVLLGTVLCGSGMVSTHECLSLLALCILGGVLPDIDSDSEASMAIVAQLFAGICAFLMILPFIDKFAILISLGLFILGYLGVRFGVLMLISKLTSHRGVLHSIPFAVLAAFLTSIVLFDIFGVTIVFAWMGAGFLFAGYLSHLVLDEFAGENLASEPINRPYGKAIKLIGFKNWIYFLVLYLVLITSFFFTPSFSSAITNIFSTQNLYKVERHLFSGSVPVEIDVPNNIDSNSSKHSHAIKKPITRPITKSINSAEPGADIIEI